MKLISWNVNGLRAIYKKDFENIFKSFDADVFCLQETKMQEGQLDVNFDGYEKFFNYAERKGYSGTAIFTKTKPKNVTYGIGMEKHDKEGRVITLEFKDFFLVNCYTPNSGRELARLDYRMDWEDAFRKYLKSLDEIKPVIVCGDFNDTPVSYTHHAFNQILKDAFVEAGNGLGISYNRNRMYVRIDHILTSKDMEVHDCQVDKSIKASDHYPIWCHVSLK